jgi:hypothetical protein
MRADYHLFIWDEGCRNYKYVKSVNREFLGNIMADPVWTQYDMCYFAH